MLFSNGGIFKVAGDAANAWNKAAINEQADLDNITEQIQNLLNGQIGGATDGLKEGNIIATNPIWKDGIASITLSKGENVASNLTIQYQIGGVEEHNWISETVGANSVTVTGLQHGNVVYARLTDGTRNGSYASTNILDKLPPENAKIELGGQSTTTARSITATVIHTDNESGVELTKCKWIYNQSQNSIGTEETSYTNTFSDSQPIALRATTPGTYYLHVLTVDKAGNKTETISQVVTVIQLVTGITLDQTSVTIGEGETVQLTATVKPNNASNQSITWSSDDDTIASVSDTGLITAKTAGTVTITVKANDESNKSTECSITVKKLATNVNEIEKKDYVLYPSSQGNLLCRLLYDNTSGYGVQIITDNIVENVTMGDGVEDTTINKYNNAIISLNNRAMKYLNTTYASDARSVGSLPNNKNSEAGYYTSSESYMSNYNGKLRDGDENYKADFDQMKELGLLSASINSYWLASRSASSLYRSGTSFYLLSVSASNGGKLTSYRMCYIAYLGEDYNDFGWHSEGLRPVFTLKPEIKITGGNGTKNNPYTLGT